MYKLEEPIYFYLFAIIPIIIVVFLLVLWWKKRTQKKFANTILLTRIAPNTSTFKSVLKLIVFILGLSFLILSLVNPKMGTKLKTVKREIEQPEENEEIKSIVKDKCHDGIYNVCKGALNKEARKDGYKKVKDEMQESLLEEKGEEWMEENGSAITNFCDFLSMKCVSFVTGWTSNFAVSMT